LDKQDAESVKRSAGATEQTKPKGK
jgi:hypothetical protein